VSWTEEGHLYAWHMKLRGKSGRVRFYVMDETGKEFKVSPRGYLTSWQRRKMATRPDMIHQFVYYLGERLRSEGKSVASIRVEARVSLNGRRRQHLLDPEVNLLQEPPTLWPATWIKPLEVPLQERRQKTFSNRRACPQGTGHDSVGQFPVGTGNPLAPQSEATFAYPSRYGSSFSQTKSTLWPGRSGARAMPLTMGNGTST